VLKCPCDAEQKQRRPISNFNDFNSRIPEISPGGCMWMMDPFFENTKTPEWSPLYGHYSTGKQFEKVAGGSGFPFRGEIRRRRHGT
jgi:hypothetical protein